MGEPRHSRRSEESILILKLEEEGSKALLLLLPEFFIGTAVFNSASGFCFACWLWRSYKANKLF
jgi:hypothetical protein